MCVYFVFLPSFYVVFELVFELLLSCCCYVHAFMILIYRIMSILAFGAPVSYFSSLIDLTVLRLAWCSSLALTLVLLSY